MGTVNDLADIIEKLSSDNNDKVFAGQLRQIQTMITRIQADQTCLAEKRIELMRENEDLRKKIDELNREVGYLKCSAEKSE
jgi:predicted nuclease with TOPRIM domain